MEMSGNFCQILELGGGLLLRDGEYLSSNDKRRVIYSLYHEKSFQHQETEICRTVNVIFFTVKYQKYLGGFFLA